MSRVISYKDLIKQRVHWNKAIKRAKFFHGEELIVFAENTALDYTRWLDTFRRDPIKATLEQCAQNLMQLEAIQYVMEERCAVASK